MPNWSSTCYVMEAKPEQAKELYDKIDSLTKMEKPLVENGFGKLWMGCLVNLLGGDWNKVYCRGEIISYTLEEGHVSLSCETAWGEMPEFRHFIEQHYPGSKVYYCSDTDCSFCLWKDNRFLESMKKTMTKDMAVDLLSHGRTYVKGLYSKKRDKCFSADLVMEVKDGKVNYALEFPKSQGRK